MDHMGFMSRLFVPLRAGHAKLSLRLGLWLWSCRIIPRWAAESNRQPFVGEDAGEPPPVCGEAGRRRVIDQSKIPLTLRLLPEPVAVEPPDQGKRASHGW